MSESDPPYRPLHYAEAELPVLKAQPPRKRRTRGFWVRQLHSWHWISSALSLAGLLLFTLTGLTLNHAADIEAKPEIVQAEASLDAALIAALRPFEDGDSKPIPAPVRKAAGDKLDITVPDSPAEWSEFEVYLAMPRPGGDAWIAIDRETGAVTYESTDRGWVAYFNDLHKGRDTGTAWRWFIDAFVVASAIFILTGFALLWMHARNRPITWPITGLGLLVPFVLALFFIH